MEKSTHTLTEKTTQNWVVAGDQIEQGYIPLSKIAECYQETYGGEPWFQEFKTEEIEKWLGEIHQIPGISIQYGMDADQDQITWYYISYIDKYPKVKELFIKEYEKIVAMNIGDIEAPSQETIRNHIQGHLNQVLDENLSETNGEILYILDVGIHPNSQRLPKVIGQTLSSIRQSIEENQPTKILAQTITGGAMDKIITRRMQGRGINQFPHTDKNSHKTIIIDQSNLSNINLKTRQQDEI